MAKQEIVDFEKCLVSFELNEEILIHRTGKDNQ